MAPLLDYYVCIACGINTCTNIYITNIYIPYNYKYIHTCTNIYIHVYTHMYICHMGYYLFLWLFDKFLLPPPHPFLIQQIVVQNSVLSPTVLDCPDSSDAVFSPYKVEDSQVGVQTPDQISLGNLHARYI